MLGLTCNGRSGVSFRWNITCQSMQVVTNLISSCVFNGRVESNAHALYLMSNVLGVLRGAHLYIVEYAKSIFTRMLK